MDLELANRLRSKLGDLDRYGVRYRTGQITATSPLSVALGGSAAPYTGVSTLDTTLGVGDVVAVLMFDNDLLIVGRIGGSRYVRSSSVVTQLGGSIVTGITSLQPGDVYAFFPSALYEPVLHVCQFQFTNISASSSAGLFLQVCNAAGTLISEVFPARVETTPKTLTGAIDLTPPAGASALQFRWQAAASVTYTADDGGSAGGVRFKARILRVG